MQSISKLNLKWLWVISCGRIYNAAESRIDLLYLNDVTEPISNIKVNHRYDCRESSKKRSKLMLLKIIPCRNYNRLHKGVRF